MSSEFRLTLESDSQIHLSPASRSQGCFVQMQASGFTPDPAYSSL